MTSAGIPQDQTTVVELLDSTGNLVSTADVLTSLWNANQSSFNASAAAKGFSLDAQPLGPSNATAGGIAITTVAGFQSWVGNSAQQNGNYSGTPTTSGMSGTEIAGVVVAGVLATGAALLWRWLRRR